MSGSANPRAVSAELLADLIRIVGSASGGRVNVPAVDGDVSLRSLGLDSGSFIALMSGIEEELGVEWDDDVPSSTFDSLHSLAAYLSTRIGVDR